MSWIKLLLLSLLAASPDQLEIPLDADVDTLLFDAPATEIVVLEPDLEQAWLEITHLGSDLPPVLVLLDRRMTAGEPYSFVPDLPPGPTMVCGGARFYGVRCEQVYRGADEYIGWPAVEAKFERGLELHGAYVQDVEAVTGARVALVPAQLEAFRPYTMPLGIRGTRVVREVRTDGDGAFEIPEIAPGDYFLEAVLPSGRVHRSDTFSVPEREAVERQLALQFAVDAESVDLEAAVPEDTSADAAPEDTSADAAPEDTTVDAVPEEAAAADAAPEDTGADGIEPEEAEPAEFYFDLGQIDVPTGLDIQFRVLDLAGDPIPGTAVSATQGRTPFDVLNFEGTSDAEGRVALHGLDVEMPVRLTCEKEGFQPFSEEYELLPVAVDCVLSSWGRVIGEVIGPDSLAPRGATVTLRQVAVRGGAAGREPFSVAVAYDGAFLVDQLREGEYELRAAAPGYRVEERTFSVDYGQEIDLGPILLLFAREIDGVVLDAHTGEPVIGVDIVALSPPGAVNTYSDLDGEFRFGVDGDETLVVEFSTFDYAKREVTLEPGDLDFSEPLVVELVPAGWILVEVENDDGDPCQGCRVVVWPGGEELWTDALGQALSGPLEAGTYRVSRPRVTHLGSTVIEQPGADMHRARVSPGRLTVVRMASVGRAIRVRFEGPLDGIWMMSARSYQRTEKTYADDDGEFPLRQQDGETLDLFLHTYDEVLGKELAVWQTTLPDNLLSDRVSVRLSGSLVYGRAVGLQGPLAGAEVRLVSFADAKLRAVVYVYPDGTFRVPHVRPGVYNIYIGTRSVKFVSVGERQTVDLGTFELFLNESGEAFGF